MDNVFCNKTKGGVDTLDQLIKSFYFRFAHKKFILFNQLDDGIEQTDSTKKQNEFILHYFHHGLFVRLWHTAEPRKYCFGQRDIKRAVY